MNKVFAIVCLLLIVNSTSNLNAQNIAINEDGSDADSTAILDLKSTNKGILVPRLTTTQQGQIVSPAKGLLIYNTTANLFMANIGTPAVPNWTAVGDLSAASAPTPTFITGKTGSDFNIVSNDPTYTFNIPYASTTARGLITDSTQTIGGKKTFADTLVANSKLILNSLSSGTSTDSLLTISSDGTINKRSVTDFVNTAPNNDFSFAEAINYEDFMFDEYSGAAGPSTAGKNDNQYSFTPVTNNATGTSSTVDGTSALYTSYGAGNTYAGIHRLTTGTTATGRAGLGSSDFANRIKLGGNQVLYEIRVRFPVLSTGSQTYTAYLGLSDLVSTTTTNVSAGSTIANGVYFTYTTAGLRGLCRNSTTTATQTSAVSITANTWYKLKAIINSTATSVDFYLDGTKIGSSITANIPSSPMKFVFLLEKSVGGTSVNCDIDYIGWKMIR